MLRFDSLAHVWRGAIFILRDESGWRKHVGRGEYRFAAQHAYAGLLQHVFLIANFRLHAFAGHHLALLAAMRRIGHVNATNALVQLAAFVQWQLFE